MTGSRIEGPLPTIPVIARPQPKRLSRVEMRHSNCPTGDARGSKNGHLLPEATTLTAAPVSALPLVDRRAAE